MRKLFILCAFVFCALPAFGQASVQTAPLCGAIDDGLTHVPANWNSLTPPAVGSSYTDGLATAINPSATPCTPYRVTDATSEFPSPYNAGKYCPALNYYPVDQPWSQQNDYLRLTTCGGWTIVKYPLLSAATPNLASPTVEIAHGHMPSDENDQDEPLWDVCPSGARGTTDNMFYYTAGATLKTGTITGVNSVTTSLFASLASSFSEILMLNFSQMSYDCEHITLGAVGLSPVNGTTPIQLLTFDLATKTVLQDYTTTCTWPGYLGAQPDNDCVHKYQITSLNNTLMDCNGNCHPGWPSPKDQSAIIGGTDLALWPDDRTSHHSVGYAQNGTTSMIVFVADFPASGGSNSLNPCDQHLGVVWMSEANITSGTPVPENCLFADYWVTGGHVSWMGGPQQPWVLIEPTSGGSSTIGPGYMSYEAQYHAPVACPYKNTTCAGASTNYSWTTDEYELILVPNDCVGNASAEGCTPGPSGRHAYRLAWQYVRDQTNYYNDTGAAISTDGRYIVVNQNIGYQGGCNSATDTSSSAYGTDGCPDTYALGPLFNAASGPAVSFSPGSLSFGNQIMGIASGQQIVTLTNAGTANLTISSVALTTGTQYALVTPGVGSDCRTIGTVAPSASCNIAVAFRPTGIGGASDTVSVTDNASGSPHTFPVGGFGILNAPALGAFAENRGHR